MKLFGWFKGERGMHAEQRQRWRAACAAAIETEDILKLDDLRSQIPLLQRPDDDVELELEMLDALERLAQLRGDEPGSLPRVETQHRVVAGEACHFTAPASLPEDAGQVAGRVLFTPSRSIFVGGARTQLVAWHAVREVVRRDRDVLLVRADGSAAAHVRFNSYADAVAAVYLARCLKRNTGSGVL